MKTCKRCGCEKPHDQFHKQASSKDGLNLYCKACIKQFQIESRDRARAAQLESAEVLPFGSHFSEFVKSNRTRLGMTQQALGDAVGATGTQVRLWEKGVSMPQQRRLRALCELFGVEVPIYMRQSNTGNLPLAVRSCDVCGKDFPVYKMRVRTCSVECGNVAKGRKQYGNSNHRWDGGTTTVSAGYVMVKAPDHPEAYQNGYVLQHRIVMEAKIGRYLHPWERVHHKNGIRDDNRPENLELWVLKGRSKKDPAGQRVDDLIEHAVSAADRYGIHPPALRSMLNAIFYSEG